MRLNVPESVSFFMVRPPFGRTACCGWIDPKIEMRFDDLYLKINRAANHFFDGGFSDVFDSITS